MIFSRLKAFELSKVGATTTNPKHKKKRYPILRKYANSMAVIVIKWRHCITERAKWVIAHLMPIFTEELKLVRCNFPKYVLYL